MDADATAPQPVGVGARARGPVRCGYGVWLASIPRWGTSGTRYLKRAFPLPMALASLDFHGADLANAYKPNSNKLISLIMLVAWASKATGEESVTTGEPFIGSGGYSISRTDRFGGWVLTSEPNLENKSETARWHRRFGKISHRIANARFGRKP